MLLASSFALAWAVVRAYTQSVTLDEADTYLWFVAKSEVFYPYPNNHVLSSLLIWVTTHLFGLSSLTLRMPSLLGAAVYISACYFLCRSLLDRFRLQFPVFICLIYNPFLMDFMVAARGYILATAFLLLAIAIPVWHDRNSRRSLDWSCFYASLALGLSFTANFSFGFVDLAAFLAIGAWAIARRKEEPYARIAGWCVLPGLCVTLLLCGYPLTHMKRGDLFYGAKSLREMTRSLIEATLYQINPRFGGSLFKGMHFLGPLLLPSLAILCAARLLVEKPARRSWFAGALAAIGVLSVLLHWFAFRFYSLPLPLSRTGMFLLPLCTLFVGVIAAAPAQSFAARWLREGMTVAFIFLACYFVLCLRLTYFKEYKYDQDVKDVYSVLAKLNHKYGVRDVMASGLYVGPLNFYRIASKKETFPEFKAVEGDFPSGGSIYVMHGPFERSFIEREKLKVIYRGKAGEVVVAVSPDGPIPGAAIDP